MSWQSLDRWATPHVSQMSVISLQLAVMWLDGMAFAAVMGFREEFMHNAPFAVNVEVVVYCLIGVLGGFKHENHECSAFVFIVSFDQLIHCASSRDLGVRLLIDLILRVDLGEG